ncbi:MAG: serine acetyltransferase [Chitinivibrionales bacterium]|nr:serine acetyltransferase [Chitinivibrionales bacterium]
MSFIALIREDWVTNDRDWSRPGFRALAVHRFGQWVMAIRPRLMRGIPAKVYWVLYRHVRNYYGIELPYKARIGRRCRIAHQSGIVVHPNARIGDDCLLRHNVTIGAARDHRAWEAPCLENGVQVGAGAQVLGPITIGEGARIGPNAVVMTNVPPGATAFGNPAQLTLHIHRRKKRTAH